MREKRAFAGRTPSALVVALVLVAFALTGLGAGVLSHSALSSLGVFASATATATTQPTATATIALSPSLSPTATNPPNSVSRFSIELTISPDQPQVGMPLTVTVTATNDGDATPADGVLCTLRTQQGDANPLFTTWPPPQTTDLTGTTQWQLTMPSVPPGQYTLEVFGQRGGASYTFDRTITLRA